MLNKCVAFVNFSATLITCFICAPLINFNVFANFTNNFGLSCTNITVTFHHRSVEDAFLKFRRNKTNHFAI